MKARYFTKPLTLIGALAVLVSGTLLAHDKYSIKVPDGLALSEFEGYERWELVSVSHPTGSDEVLNVIVANPAMIEAYASGIPGNGEPFPNGAMTVKIQYLPKKSAEAPFDAAIPDKLKDIAVMVKDAKRFPDSGGWGYGLFDYDAANDQFTPNGSGSNCGAACHTIVKAKDYVFTRYEKR